MSKMKRFLLLSIILLLFASCSKGKETDTPGSIEYKLNGTQFSFSKCSIRKIPGSPGITPTKYLIKGSTGNNSLEMFIPTYSDTLKEQSYTLDSGALPIFVAGNITYSFMDEPFNFITISVTSYKKGHVSGTFNGEVTNLSGPVDATITDGKLNDVPVSY